MTSTLRVAMTQTRNAYRQMPQTVDALEELAAKLDEIRDANLEHNERLIKSAHRQGAKIICLGELFAAPYFALEAHDFWLKMAEDAKNGPCAKALSKLAQDLEVVIVAPLYEYDADKDRRYNAAIVIDADGKILGRYRKTHIPQGTNDIGSFFERHYYTSADEAPYFPVFDTRYAKLGVSIC